MIYPVLLLVMNGNLLVSLLLQMTLEFLTKQPVHSIQETKFIVSSKYSTFANDNSQKYTLSYLVFVKSVSRFFHYSTSTRTLGEVY